MLYWRSFCMRNWRIFKGNIFIFSINISNFSAPNLTSLVYPALRNPTFLLQLVSFSCYFSKSLLWLLLLNRRWSYYYYLVIFADYEALRSLPKILIWIGVSEQSCEASVCRVSPSLYGIQAVGGCVGQHFNIFNYGIFTSTKIAANNLIGLLLNDNNHELVELTYSET